jgi:hypothetical protein
MSDSWENIFVLYCLRLKHQVIILKSRKWLPFYKILPNFFLRNLNIYSFISFLSLWQKIGTQELHVRILVHYSSRPLQCVYFAPIEMLIFRAHCNVYTSCPLKCIYYGPIAMHLQFYFFLSLVLEWGDLRKEEYYYYLKSYSRYLRIPTQMYKIRIKKAESPAVPPQRWVFPPPLGTSEHDM